MDAGLSQAIRRAHEGAGNCAIPDAHGGYRLQRLIGKYTSSRRTATLPVRVGPPDGPPHTTTLPRVRSDPPTTSMRNRAPRRDSITPRTRRPRGPLAGRKRRTRAATARKGNRGGGSYVADSIQQQ